MRKQQEEQIEIVVEGCGRKEDDHNIIMSKFEQFDMISADSQNAISDHHFASSSSSKPSNKKVTKEWKILKQDLPHDSIYVRVYETRIDLLRAVIIGISCTPHHDGLFFFDVQLTTDYPNSPPSVHYRSFGIRLNLNLYSDGKVCLSLLNTWAGPRWNPSQSTLLQVLLSLQGLVLNENPYFNEPGLGMFGAKTSTSGQTKSMHYDEQVFMLSLRTMLRLLRTSPKHFEDFVAQHFRERDKIILAACKAYMSGRLRIGEDITQFINQPSTMAPINAVRKDEFLNPMKKIYPKLVKEFQRNGSSGLDEYLVGYNEEDIIEVDDDSNLEAAPEINPGCCLVVLLFFLCILIGVGFFLKYTR
ncbi:hypothetical protein MKW92_012802 [Papaver armeniacum]|nr:hypothetical protein MKW92_012802 [Papaver armeniacum]